MSEGLTAMGPRLHRACLFGGARELRALDVTLQALTSSWCAVSEEEARAVSRALFLGWVVDRCWGFAATRGWIGS